MRQCACETSLTRAHTITCINTKDAQKPCVFNTHTHTLNELNTSSLKVSNIASEGHTPQNFIQFRFRWHKNTQSEFMHRHTDSTRSQVKSIKEHGDKCICLRSYNLCLRCLNGIKNHFNKHKQTFRVRYSLPRSKATVHYPRLSYKAPLAEQILL